MQQFMPRQGNEKKESQKERKTNGNLNFKFSSLRWCFSQSIVVATPISVYFRCLDTRGGKPSFDSGEN
jgi:hypothetical protein